MVLIFLTQWFTLSFIIIIANGNFPKTILKNIPVHGKYIDFDSDWYFDTGLLIVRSL
jgi:hypothetical protein